MILYSGELRGIWGGEKVKDLMTGMNKIQITKIEQSIDFIHTFTQVIQ